MRSREVYDQLRSEIARGELRPNERLIEADLALRLSVSRTPVRESIQRLAVDGLVVNRRRAWFVREHSPAEITALYEVREALEGYAARLAAESARHQDERRHIIDAQSGRASVSDLRARSGSSDINSFGSTTRSRCGGAATQLACNAAARRQPRLLLQPPDLRRLRPTSRRQGGPATSTSALADAVARGAGPGGRDHQPPAHRPFARAWPCASWPDPTQTSRRYG